MKYSTSVAAFSAALTAYVAAHYDDLAHQIRLCAPVPFTHTLEDYPRAEPGQSLREWSNCVDDRLVRGFQFHWPV